MPRPLVRFVELFNDEAFWDSHEVLEGPWRARGSAFYHGLILYASAFVHVQRDNPHGIGAQLRKTEEALEPFPRAYLGLDVAGILRVARTLRERVEGSPEDPTRSWADRITFPRLRLDPKRIRGDEPELVPDGAEP